jgi:hypothetical protein
LIRPFEPGKRLLIQVFRLRDVKGVYKASGNGPGYLQNNRIRDITVAHQFDKQVPLSGLDGAKGAGVLQVNAVLCGIHAHGTESFNLSYKIAEQLSHLRLAILKVSIQG